MRTFLTSTFLALAWSATALGQTATVGAQTSTFSGPTRGYTFLAPVNFVITGVKVLSPTGAGNAYQNFAIVRFDGAVPPPVFNATTNSFSQLALGLDRDQTLFQPVDVQVLAGELIGVYGNTTTGIGTTFGSTSYAGVVQQATMIGGISVNLDRTGMQFHLGSATSPAGMHDIWAVPTVFDISRVEFTYTLGGGSVGMNYCTAAANSTGVPSAMSASGSDFVINNDLVLGSGDLPDGSFAFFLTGQVQGFVPNPGGSQGNLCLSGAIGRFVGPGQIQQAGPVGEISLAIDLMQMPQPAGFVSASAGETWNFQAWYRDAVGGVATSNFTDGLEVTLQ